MDKGSPLPKEGGKLMKTPIQEEHIKELVDKRRKHKTNQFYATAAVSVLTILGLLYIGMLFQQSRERKPLPANQACSQAIDKLPLQLRASIDAQFGIPVPNGTPSQAEVSQLIKDCKATQTKYEVTVGEK